MSIKSKDIIGLSVITIAEGKKIGKVNDIIYDPNEQRIKALEIGNAGWFSDAKILLIENVRSIGQDALLIESEKSLQKIVNVPPEIARIAQNNHYLTRSEILTTDGTELGNVTDIYFDPKTGIVESFEVTKSGLKNFQSVPKQVLVSDIIAVGEDATIVRVATDKKSAFGFEEKIAPLKPYVLADKEPKAKPDDILTNIDPMQQIMDQQSKAYASAGYLGGKSKHETEKGEVNSDMRHYTVLGIFRDRADVEQAIAHLREDGFRSKDISLLMKDEAVAQGVASTTGSNNIAGGAVTGATTGAVIGRIAGLLAGIGALAIPGLGGFLVGGPLAAALGLTGEAATTAIGAVTGAVARGLLSAIMGLRIPEEEARVYETEVQAGGILLTVPATENRVDDARDILEEFGASQVKAVLLPRDHMYELDDEEDVDNDYHSRYGADEPAYFAGFKGGRSRKRHRDWEE